MKMNLGGGMKMNGCLCKFFIMSILRVLKWRMKLYCVDDVVQKKWTIWWIGERCRAPYACSVQFDVRYSARLGFKSKPSIGEMDDRMATLHTAQHRLCSTASANILPCIDPHKTLPSKCHNPISSWKLSTPISTLWSCVGFLFFSCRLYVYTL